MSKPGQSIDWAEVKRRLAESQLGLERALSAGPERIQAAYRARAAQLAGRRVQAVASGTTLRVLVFLLGGVRYALEFGDLAELLPFGNCTPLPGASPLIAGVANIHGEIRSVIDLGRLLGAAEADQSAEGYILLVRRQGREVGLRVDGIDKIESIPSDGMTEAGAGGAEPQTRYVKGIAAGKLIVLSTEAVLAHPIFQGTHADQLPSKT